MIVGVIRRKPVLTHASIVCEGMLASVNSVNHNHAHHAKFHFDPTTWMVTANTQFAIVGFLSVPFFLFWSLRHAHRSHRWTDFDDLYVI